MSEIVVLVKEILCCPECLKKRKIKRFPNTQNLNMHLTKSHRAGFKLAGEITYIPVTKSQ